MSIASEMPEVLTRFAEMIQDFRPLYQSARLSCIAARRDGKWFNLAARFQLREFSPDQNPWSIQPTDDFIASVIEIPVSDFWQALFKIISSSTIPQECLEEVIGRAVSDINLTAPPTSPGHQSTFGWPPAQEFARRWSLPQFGIDGKCIAIAAYGDSPEKSVGNGFLQRVEPKLRLRTSYIGIPDLVTQLMPGTTIQEGTSSSFVVLAPFPFRLRAYAISNRNGIEVIAAPKAEIHDVLVRSFPKPDGGPIEPALKPKKNPDDGCSRLDIKFKWPKGACRTQFVLFYKGHEVDDLEIGRWPGLMELRVAINSYFDPGHKLLADLLKSSGQGKEQNNFELGVVRLLNLLGIPVTWYSQKTAQRRSDAVGYVEVNGKRVVVLCECTIESPDRKFSALKERASHLHHHLHGEAEVRPLLFCPTDPIASDYERAKEHGITLVGKAELSQLVEMLEKAVDAEATLKAFEQFNRALDFGGLFWTPSRFSPRF